MAPYRAPNLGDDYFTRFVRVESELYVGQFEEVGHKDIVEEDGLAERIDALKASDPTQLDAGFLRVRGGGEIQVIDNSSRLHLPVAGLFSEARRISNETFAEQSPNHTVFGLERR